MSEKQLSLTGKVVSIATGPILGMLPPRKQIQLAKGSREAACYMSSTSRIFNGVWTLYTIGSLSSRAFGADIDPSAGDILTLSGIAIGLDSLVREVMYAGTAYFHDGGSFSFHEPWGEPILSIVDSMRRSNRYAL